MPSLVFWSFFWTSFLINSQQAEPSTTDSANCSVCLTPGCVKAAEYILRNMDESVDPCEDFFQFACGGWLDSHTTSEKRSYVGIGRDLQKDVDLMVRESIQKEVDESEPDFVKNMKRMYTSCMNTSKIEDEGSEPLLRTLKTLGGWPVLEGESWDASKFDWMDTLFQIRKLGLDHNIMFMTVVKNDYENKENNAIYFSQTSFPLNILDYAIKTPRLLAYKKLMVDVAKKLGANAETVEAEMEEVFQFESSLYMVNVKGDFEKKINNVQELQELASQIDWLKYFNGLLNDPISPDEPLRMDEGKFAVHSQNVITTTDPRVVANYLMWDVALQTLGLMSNTWRTLYLNYLIQVRNMDVPKEPMWKKCLKRISKVGISSLFVRNNLKEFHKDQVLEMVPYLKKEFLSHLDNMDWLDSEMKTKIEEKANAMEVFVGYSDNLLDDSKMTEYFENLSVTDDFFDNTLNLWKLERDHEYNELRKPFIKYNWKRAESATDVEAVYWPRLNTIEILAGIIQHPYFNKDRPQYVNFGAFGMVIGHEITHGFDTTGRQFDKDGQYINWWDKKTSKAYKEKAYCFVEQYNKYPAGNGQMVGELRTQGENIADNGGLRQAYWAYQSWVKEHGAEPKLPGLKYSPSQLFWIGNAGIWCGKITPEELKTFYSQTHSPPKYRVNGPVSNRPEFAKDFECAPNSPMNPENKCELW